MGNLYTRNQQAQFYQRGQDAAGKILDGAERVTTSVRRGDIAGAIQGVAGVARGIEVAARTVADEVLTAQAQSQGTMQAPLDGSGIRRGLPAGVQEGHNRIQDGVFDSATAVARMRRGDSQAVGQGMKGATNVATGVVEAVAGGITHLADTFVRGRGQR